MKRTLFFVLAVLGFSMSASANWNELQVKGVIATCDPSPALYLQFSWEAEDRIWSILVPASIDDSNEIRLLYNSNVIAQTAESKETIFGNCGVLRHASLRRDLFPRANLYPSSTTGYVVSNLEINRFDGFRLALVSNISATFRRK